MLRKPTEGDIQGLADRGGLEIISMKALGHGQFHAHLSPIQRTKAQKLASVRTMVVLMISRLPSSTEWRCYATDAIAGTRTIRKLTKKKGELYFFQYEIALPE